MPAVMRYISFLFLLGIFSNFSYGQNTTIIIPGHSDKYSAYVKSLEEGNLDIDYADFRQSFIDSKQFALKGTKYDSLKREISVAIKERNYNKVIEVTKAMLSIDYTSMYAHKFLQQTYKIQGDTINRNKYHDIEFGLLNSIMKSGDGKSCETGWHVTQIEEEYFILYILGGTFKSQSISSSSKNMCDKMVVRMENGEEETFFFEANKVFEKERKLFGGN